MTEEQRKAEICDKVRAALEQSDPENAVALLCAELEQAGDYHNLFYALLMKKRVELGVNPVPTAPAEQLPAETHAPYEDAIRNAARHVGRLFLERGDIANAWSYFGMIGEPEEVARAIDRYQPTDEDEDSEAVINIAYHQGVNPKRGFDLILDRYGICSAITTLGSGNTGHSEEVRVYCIKRVVQTLYEELRERLIADIAGQESEPIPPDTPVGELIKGRPWLFRDDMYHVDVSHLSAAIQMSVHLPSDSEELALAREMCAYGERLSPQFHYHSEPPFDDQYKDYGVYLAVLAGDDVEEGIEHFRKKIAAIDLEEIGTYPVEVFVNLLLRAGRIDEAVDVAAKYLVQSDERQLTCPGVVELCVRAGRYETLAELARQHENPVHYLAGLIAARTATPAAAKV